MAPKHGRKKASKSKQSTDDETYRENFIRTNKVDVNYLKTKASQGSIVAAGVLDSLSACLHLLDFLEGKEGIPESECMDLMRLAYGCIAQEYQPYNFLGSILDLLKEISDALYIGSHLRTGEDEMKLRFCYIRFSYEPLFFNDYQMPGQMLAVLKEGVEMYPDNVHYYIAIVAAYNALEDLKSALFYAERGVKRFPDNPQLLLFKASMLQMSILVSDTETKRVDVIAAFQEFLSKAPEDDPSIPNAYYHMATAYADEMGTANGKKIMERFYNLGKLAEKKILPCFLERESHDLKTAVEALLSYSGNKEATQKIKEMLLAAKAKKLGVLQKKPFLDNPNRKELIISHRLFRNEMNRLSGDFAQLLNFKPELAPKLKQTIPKKSQLKPITFKDMSSKFDTIYEDRVINLTIIEEPGVKSSWIQVIAEDKNRDVARLTIYNEKVSKESLDMFGVGKKIAISNPYIEVGNQGFGLCLRNDEPKCIEYLGQVPNMCWFCGEDHAAQKCSQCKKAWYCSKECQHHDWKVLKHKLICSKL